MTKAKIILLKKENTSMKIINTSFIVFSSNGIISVFKGITRCISDLRILSFTILVLCMFNFFNLTAFAQPCEANGYPFNTADINWTDTGGADGNECPPYTPGNATFNGITDIVAAFNHARTAENGQSLGIRQVSMPMMTTAELGGSDVVWNAKSNSEKAFILMNLERSARGINPFQEVDANVQNVAQNYAEYLRAHNQFDHDLDCGGVVPCDPTVRMSQNAAINGHQEFTCRFENLAAFFAPDAACAPLTVERAVYGWIYQDISSGNGHRNACLFNGFNDNYSTGGAEGQIGIGLATGPYSGANYGVVIVFDFFDPNASYNPTVPVVLNTKIFLQGSYSSGSMSTILNSGGYLKTNASDQPFNKAPWNYSGSESVSSDPNFFTNNPSISDWVLVELRTTTDASSIQGTRAGFIKSDGIIVDTDGKSLLKFNGVSNGDYYIVIEQRNHLAVMSAGAVTLSTTGNTLYDFTTGSSQFKGSDIGAKELETNVWGMIAGDANDDGLVTTLDYNFWLPKARAAATGYDNTDINLDGHVTTLDYNLWLPNARAAKSSQVPK